VQHALLRKLGDGLSVGHLPSLWRAQGEWLQSCTPYVGTWGPFYGSAPVWCVQVVLHNKQLSYGVCVVQNMYYDAPQATLDAKVQDVAHQALTALCQEL
jgi:hypothetical protein